MEYPSPNVLLATGSHWSTSRKLLDPFIRLGRPWDRPFSSAQRTAGTGHDIGLVMGTSTTAKYGGWWFQTFLQTCDWNDHPTWLHFFHQTVSCGSCKIETPKMKSWCERGGFLPSSLDTRKKYIFRIQKNSLCPRPEIICVTNICLILLICFIWKIFFDPSLAGFHSWNIYSEIPNKKQTAHVLRGGAYWTHAQTLYHVEVSHAL